MIALTTLILEYDNVHGRILAVNMAHIRKKRQTAENGSQDDNRNNSLGGNVFLGIQEANRGKEASAK